MKIVRTAREYAALKPSEKVARRQALEALALMRSDVLSLAKAARQAGTTPRTVRRFAGEALTQDRRGRIVAKPADRLFRRMQILTADGKKTVDIRGSLIASRVGDYWNAVHTFRDTGDETRLREFADFYPGGERVETDPASLEAMARRGELDFEDIYELTA